jgi:hypothetical protein
LAGVSNAVDSGDLRITDIFTNTRFFRLPSGQQSFLDATFNQAFFDLSSNIDE